jgi:S-DNA-T family DNA segregation ATPase FtsK/SpoIIIE
METETFYRKRDVPLIVPLGRDVSGDPIVASLASMPHVLIAGTTGSGKSVCLTSMIAGLVMNNRPDTLRMILLDPKMVELNRFAGLPHLLGPVEIETERIIGVLRWAAREMDRRYKLLELENARNLEAYNQQLGEERRTEHLPYIVIVVDEIGDLMMTRPEETEKTLTRLAQKARAAGMHLVVATQRPSVDVITGLIKANFPARISFAVASGTDSRVILDAVGAETLVGRGDMLFQAPDAAAPQRLQGCFISDEEIYEILMYWKAWQAEQSASLGTDDQPASPPWEQSLTRYEALERLDPMLEEALQMVVAEGRASVSQVQKRLGIDYARAARIMDSLRELGIIGGTLAGGTNRKVLVKSLEEARRMIHNNRRGN